MSIRKEVVCARDSWKLPVHNVAGVEPFPRGTSELNRSLDRVECIKICEGDTSLWSVSM